MNCSNVTIHPGAMLVDSMLGNGTEVQAHTWIERCTIGTNCRIRRYCNLYDSTLGDGTSVAGHVEIGGTRIGRRCRIQGFAFLPPGVTVEDDVFIGPHACFTNDRHPRSSGEWTLEPTLVGRGASVGAGAIILCGVTIGPGAVVGAGAIVTKDVPAGATVIRQ